MIIASAGLWAEDLGLQMTWWKWLLAAAWYGLLSYTLAGAFTLLGEKEPAAWYRSLVFHLIVTIVLGAILSYFLLR